MSMTTQEALDRGGVIDITTVGARSGLPRRIEINFVTVGGKHYISGRPGSKRDWLANLRANPGFVVHLKHGVTADVAATARLITDGDERTDVIYRILTEGWGNEESKAQHILPRWVDGAPLIEFTIDATP